MEEEGSWTDSLHHKDKELHQIAKLRIAQLQEQGTLKDQYIVELQQRLKRICEDFNYNFQLIEERDKELRNFEQQIAALNSALKAKDAEIADFRRLLQTKEDDLKAEVDFLKLKLEDCTQTNEQLRSREANYLQQEADTSLQLESFQRTFNDLSQAHSVLDSRCALLEEQKSSLEKQLEAERERCREVLESHRMCRNVEERLRDEVRNLQTVSEGRTARVEELEERTKTLETEKSETAKEVGRMRKEREAEVAEIRARIAEEGESARLKQQLKNLQEAYSLAKSQKETFEEVTSGLERELDLERKERAKDKRALREAQNRAENDSADRGMHWQSIAESRAEELVQVRRTATQAEEQVRALERELQRYKKTSELEDRKRHDDSRQLSSLQSQLASIEREKARLQAELRQIRPPDLDPLVTRRGAQRFISPTHSFDLKRQSFDMSSDRKEVSLDTVPSRDVRLMAGLKQRIAQVKDQLDAKFNRQ